MTSKVFENGKFLELFSSIDDIVAIQQKTGHRILDSNLAKTLNAGVKSNGLMELRNHPNETVPYLRSILSTLLRIPKKAQRHAADCTTAAFTTLPTTDASSAQATDASALPEVL
ncbi:MAG: hypothetical protein LQ340_001867 [Diploschistes diacapsis]|nr:MAG: hypothetical protein LQ340_001867 [Diploschistes diacapsis]